MSANTSPDNIVYPTADQEIKLPTDLAAMASSIQTAITKRDTQMYLRYTTKAAMVAVPGTAPRQHATVYDDTTVSNRGDYIWDGAQWVKDSDDTGWISPALGNSWVNTAAMPIQYRKIGGIVYLRGRATGGSTGTAFTLPSGYRYSYTDQKYIVQNGSVSGTSTTVTITSAGAVQFVTGTAPYLYNIPPYPADA